MHVISEYLPSKVFEGLCTKFGKEASDILRDNRKRKKKEISLEKGNEENNSHLGNVEMELGEGAPPNKKLKSSRWGNGGMEEKEDPPPKPKPKPKKIQLSRGAAQLAKVNTRGMSKLSKWFKPKPKKKKS